MIDFKQALIHFSKFKQNIPGHLQWWPQDNTISKRLANHDIKGSSRHISSTFTAIAKILVESCDWESEQAINEMKEAAKNVETIANFQINSESKEGESNSNNNKIKSDNDSNKTTNKNNSAAKPSVTKSQPKKNKTGKKSKKKKNKTGKKSKKKKNKTDKSSKDKNENHRQFKRLSVHENIIQWGKTKMLIQATNAYILARLGNLSNKNMQTMSCLNQTRVRNAMMHARMIAPANVDLDAIIQRFEYLLNHSTYSSFIKPLLKRIDNAHKLVGAPRPRKIDIMHENIKFLLSLPLGGNKKFIFYKLDFTDMTNFNHDPLKNVKTEGNPKARALKAMVQLWKHWEDTDSRLYIVNKKAFFMSTCHFASLAEIFAPKLWEAIRSNPLCVLETTFKQIVPKILSKHALTEYERKLSDYESGKISNDTYSVDANVVKAMQSQLKKYLIAQCGKEDWINEAYYVIVYGFIVPLMCLNHVTVLQAANNDMVYPVAQSIFKSGQEKYFWKNTHIYITLMLKWLRATANKSWASQLLQPSRLNTVFPDEYYILMNQLKTRPGKFLDICKFVCMLPNIIYCSYFESKINGKGNGLALGFQSIVKSRGDWMSDLFWKRTPMMKVPSNRKKIFGFIVPVTTAVPLYFGKIYAALTTVKFPKFVYGPDWLVAVFLDPIVPGYHYCFTDSKGLNIPESQRSLFIQFFEMIGGYTCKMQSTESFWTMLYQNTMEHPYMFCGYIKVKPPVSPQSAQAKYLFNECKEWNARMFTSSIMISYCLCLHQVS